MQDLNSEREQRIQTQLQEISVNIVEAAKQMRVYSCKTNLVDAYTMVYDACIQKPGKSEKMLNNFKNLLACHLMSCSLLLANDNRIKEFNKIYHNYVLYAKILSKRVFAYLDRYYLPARDLDSLLKVAMNIFYRSQLGTDQGKHSLIQCLIKVLGEFRADLIFTDNQYMDFSINMIRLDQSFYSEIMEVYLKESEEFYKKKFQETKTLAPAIYYPQVYNLAIFEQTISAKCFLWDLNHPENKVKLTESFKKEMVEPYTEILLTHSQGLIWALKFKKFNVLRSIIEVATKFSCLAKIKESYYSYVKEEMVQLIKNLEDEKDEGKIVSLLIAFFHDHNDLLVQGFKKNQELQVTLSNALESVLGKWQRYLQVLFNYCKWIVNEGKFQQKSAEIRIVFQKLVNKDEFIHKCQIWLSQLMFSQNIDLSKQSQFFNFLDKLCGSESTLRLQNIVKDYFAENKIISEGLLRPKVFSYHLWQKRFKDELAIDLKVAPVLLPLWSEFQSKYSDINLRKKLTLLPLSSTLQLKMKFTNRIATINCNLLQCCLILGLASNCKTLEELQQQINVEKHLLQSFIQLTKFIVLKEGSYFIDWGTEVAENIDMTVRLQDNSQFTKAVEQDRNILLEAAIVKVTKRRKQISFEDIYSNLCECIKMFKPKPAMVKTTIERLIKKDYIQQSEQGLYFYKE